MIQNCPNTIVKIFKDNNTDDRYIYTNKNGNVMFSTLTSSGSIDEHTLDEHTSIEAFKQVVDSDISQFKFMMSNSALYLTGKLS